MNLADIEAAIVNRLASYLPDMDVQAFPDNPATYKMGHPLGAVLVNYHGSDYGKPLGTDCLPQIRHLEWDLTIQVRNLRSNAGAYPVIETVRQALHGWGQNEVGGKFLMIRDNFEGASHGVWTYRVVVAHDLMAIPGQSPQTQEFDASPGNITSITMQNNLGEEIVIGGSSGNG